jgi:hypothetical protein
MKVSQIGEKSGKFDSSYSKLRTSRKRSFPPLHGLESYTADFVTLRF